MALERGYRVSCDKCGAVHFAAHELSPRAARTEAKRTGWVRSIVGGGWKGAIRRDYCPKCVEAMDKQEVSDALAVAQHAATPVAADWMHTFPPEWERHPWANYAHLVASSGMDGIHFAWCYYECEPKWGKLSYNWVGGKWGYNNPAKRAPLSLFFDTRATLTQRPGQGTSRR